MYMTYPERKVSDPRNEAVLMPLLAEQFRVRLIGGLTAHIYLFEYSKVGFKYIKRL